jgi:hypothetical protein
MLWARARIWAWSRAWSREGVGKDGGVWGKDVCRGVDKGLAGGLVVDEGEGLGEDIGEGTCVSVVVGKDEGLA